MHSVSSWATAERIASSPIQALNEQHKVQNSFLHEWRTGPPIEPIKLSYVTDVSDLESRAAHACGKPVLHPPCTGADRERCRGGGPLQGRTVLSLSDSSRGGKLIRDGEQEA